MTCARATMDNCSFSATAATEDTAGVRAEGVCAGGEGSGISGVKVGGCMGVTLLGEGITRSGGPEAGRSGALEAKRRLDQSVWLASRPAIVSEATAWAAMARFSRSLVTGAD